MWFVTVFSWLWKPLAWVGAGLLAIGAVFLKGRSEGRELERAKHIDKVLENADEARRARDDPDNSGVRKFDRSK